MSDPAPDDTQFFNRDTQHEPVSPTPGKAGKSRAPSGEADKTRPAEAVAPASASVDLVGKQLGDFRVLRRLGSGAMAEVFLAEQLSLKRPVALKILRKELLQESDDTHLKRFIQEATAAANLNHPHIVQVYAIGNQENVHFIAQEYVAGMTLREWLRKSGPPEALRAIYVIRQVALALQAADEAGIVHRDIKPENILLTKKLEAKVTDFGLAQLSRQDENTQLTQVGMTMGTPLYMSPEQVAGKSLDHRSDIYSLGVTTYHLLAGAPPFQGETALSVAVQHINVDPEMLAASRPDLPVALCQIVEKMMAKRPEDRYQHAGELAEDLARLGASLKQDPNNANKLPLGSFTVARKSPQGKWPLSLDQFFHWSARRHAMFLAPLALLLFLAGLGAGWSAQPENPFNAPDNFLVSRKNSARDQYFNAIISGSPEAYAAVRKEFPDGYPWVTWADVRLGIIRISERDWDGAREIFHELAISEEDEQARIDGQTGLALVAAFDAPPAEFKKQLANADVGNAHRELQRLLMGMREHRGVDAEVRDILNDLLPPEEWEESETSEAAPPN